MAVGTNVVAVRYEDVEAGTPISVPYPLYEALDIKVYYGRAALVAVYNTDYTITLGDDFDTFTLTPTASLIAKIDALIVADPTEENYITVRRTLDYLTDSTAAAVRYTPFTSREFERTALRFQQIDERLNRALVLSPNFVGDNPLLQLLDAEVGHALVVGATGVESGPSVTEISNAQGYAEDAEAAAAAAQAAAAAAQAAAASIDYITVADRTALKALDTSTITAAYLKETGREGQWLWDATVPMATHQADAGENRYVAPNAAADGAWVRAGSVETGGRWTTDNPPARIFPFGGRVFVGASSENDGAAGPGRLHSWFDDSEYVGMHSSWMSLEQNAQFAAVTNSGLGSIVGASRSSDYPGITGGTIGVTGWGFNDSTDHASGAWGGYFIGVSKPGALAGVIGAEIGSWNQDEDAPYISPYNMFPSKAVYALHLANGIPAAHGADTPSYLASSALSIINNHETDGKFWAGIVIASTALETSPVDPQTSMAIALAKRHAIQWFTPGNGLGPSIFSEVDTPTGDALYKLAFTDNGVQVRNFLNIPLFRVAAVPNAVNRLDIFPGTSGQPVTLAAVGDDTNIDVVLIPQGSGVLNIGGPVIVGSAGAQVGYLTLKYNNTTFRVPVYSEA